MSPRALLRGSLRAIAALTLVSGLVQLVTPRTVLALVGGAITPTAAHVFAIVGMFMALFGGLMLQALWAAEDAPGTALVTFWTGLQKLGASAAVAVGVSRGLFATQALLVAGFDLSSAVLAGLYWILIRRPAEVREAAPAPRSTAPPARVSPVARLAALAPAPGTRAAKRSLILAGGGMRVAYQAGVVRALFEEGLVFDHGDGTSGGVINLAMLLSGLSPAEMCDRWRTLDPKHFISLMPLHEYLRADDMLAMGSAAGLVGEVFPHLGIDLARINAARAMAGTFNVCNFTDKTTEVIPHDRLDMDYLVAGVSLPIFMPPVEKEGRLYTDSVWIRDANLMEAVRRGADELWVVWCIGNSPAYHKGAFHQYVHMIEMSANGSLFQELERIEEINERIRGGEVVWGHDRPIRLHVIHPPHPLPLDPDYILGKIDAATLISLGYADAKRYLQQRVEEGLPFSPEATKMTDVAPATTSARWWARAS